ncbi:MAG: hypothetical protein V3W41_02020 [Planctomycetota bacterium]
MASWKIVDSVANAQFLGALTVDFNAPGGTTQSEDLYEADYPSDPPYEYGPNTITFTGVSNTTTQFLLVRIYCVDDETGVHTLIGVAGISPMTTLSFPRITVSCPEHSHLKVTVQPQFGSETTVLQ